LLLTLEPAAGARVLRGLCGGEALPPELAERLLDRVSSLWNVYGPTETTIWSTIDRPARGDRITIGRPLANTRVYVLDEQLEPTPVGAVGDLYIGGVGVAGGYWRRPSLTAARFVADPHGPPGERVYRTGDLARYRPDGRIEYVGRDDFQVKLRGFRIELGEIEAQLAACPGVREAVVVARQTGGGDTRLAAYVTTTGPAALPVDELRRHLSRVLPEYMVPATYVALAAMPLTLNGKVDRAALPEPGSEAHVTRAYEAPQGETERRVAAIWAEVLGLEQVGRHDNFFELGGHSLLAVGVIERMRQAGLQADVRALFATASLASLASATKQIHEIVL
jgi:acyl-coenzyme A synthetase/AMP-(fatty) acid ligase